jgi:hypothetical protein
MERGGFRPLGPCGGPLLPSVGTDFGGRRRGPREGGSRQARLRPIPPPHAGPVAEEVIEIFHEESFTPPLVGNHHDLTR